MLPGQGCRSRKTVAACLHGSDAGLSRRGRTHLLSLLLPPLRRPPPLLRLRLALLLPPPMLLLLLVLVLLVLLLLRLLVLLWLLGLRLRLLPRLRLQLLPPPCRWSRGWPRFLLLLGLRWAPLRLRTKLTELEVSVPRVELLVEFHSLGAK